MVRKRIGVLVCVCLLLVGITACMTPATSSVTEEIYTVDTVPAFEGVPYVAINGNVPTFTKAEMVAEGYEVYAPLDILGRCGAAQACVGRSSADRRCQVRDDL